MRVSTGICSPVAFVALSRCLFMPYSHSSMTVFTKLYVHRQPPPREELIIVEIICFRIRIQDFLT